MNPAADIYPRIPYVAPGEREGTWVGEAAALQTFLELGALPGAVPCARLHARQVLWEWGLAGVADNVELVVSELVTNAVAVSPAADRVLPVRLWLQSDKTQIVISVWDTDPQRPARVEAGDYAESGRGVFIVEAVSKKWGSYVTPQLGGKVVWAVCEI